MTFVATASTPWLRGTALSLNELEGQIHFSKKRRPRTYEALLPFARFSCHSLARFYPNISETSFGRQISLVSFSLMSPASPGGFSFFNGQTIPLKLVPSWRDPDSIAFPDR